jgi:hypothetical protein
MFQVCWQPQRSSKQNSVFGALVVASALLLIYIAMTDEDLDFLV